MRTAVRRFYDTVRVLCVNFKTKLITKRTRKLAIPLQTCDLPLPLLPLSRRWIGADWHRRVFCPLLFSSNSSRTRLSAFAPTLSQRPERISGTHRRFRNSVSRECTWFATASHIMLMLTFAISAFAAPLPHRVVVAGGTHGNEYTGVYVLDRLAQQKDQLKRDYPSLSVEPILANPVAHKANRRFVDNDLNRCSLRSTLRITPWRAMSRNAQRRSSN